MKQKPVVALVQGDPAGIGPELMVKLLNEDQVRERADILIIGAPNVIARGEAATGISIDRTHVKELDVDAIRTSLQHKDLDIPDIDDVPIASVSAAGGLSSLAGLTEAFELSRDGVVDGVCFMPFNKESMHKGGNPFMDEIGFARDFFGVTTRASEFNIAHGMWNGRVTSHVPMKDVAGMLDEERICDSIELAHNTLRMAGYERPRIVVAAYNPHAGEGGIMGREEIDIIQPAVVRMQQRQMKVEGPFPADTLWLKVRDGQYDVVVTMYHDQGQIAIKLLGFDQGVSMLAGLPVPVTTPAHGTAFDIAGKNLANLDPARNAFMMVCDMAEGLSREGGWYRGETRGQ
ncbi:MAG: 4-hydroxythreonine-4-phosphate dehydrogenase PdxA [Gammaproteobacteria bacterium]|nr:4-hydroxythreonine-4-phosphate dehydrogenase PdxA [Gammaproteobacteria bacterium]